MSPFSFDPILTLNNDEAYNNKQLHDKYIAACVNWKAENARNREIGQPLTPVPPIPMQTVWFEGPDGNPASKQVPFPDLSIPVLDPAPVTVPSVPFSQDASLNDKLTMAIYKVVLDIQSRMPKSG